MALGHVPLDQINKSHLDDLLAAKIQESRDIEYKRNTYGKSDKDHAEFLADISSFANTSGGDVVIGVTAERGVPTSFSPFTGDQDEEIIRLEQIARNGLQPRIASLQIKAIPVDQMGHVIVVRIPRTYNPPHRIVRQGTGQHRFWARSSAGKYEPNVEELRTLFTYAPHMVQRIRDFRIDRVAKISSGAAPVRLLNPQWFAMHLIPLATLDNVGALPLRDLVRDRPGAFTPIGSTQFTWSRVNLDGLLTGSNLDEGAAQRAYVQVFRTGIVEAVASLALDSGRDGKSPHLVGQHIEDDILHGLERYAKTLAAIQIQPPLALLVTLYGAKGVQLTFNPTWIDRYGEAVDRDEVQFHEVIIEELPTDKAGWALAARPIFDQIANIAGFASSSSFDESGKFSR